MNERNEDRSSYYYLNGERVLLEREPSVYAVRFRPGERSDSPALSRKSRRFLRDDSSHLSFIPNYGMQIYQANPRDLPDNVDRATIAATVSRSLRSVDEQATVEFATPAFRRGPDTDELMFVTNRFVAQFKPDVTREQIDELNRRHGVQVVEELDYADNGYLLQAPHGEGEGGVVEVANAYFESGLTVFSHPDFVRQRHVRVVGTASSAETEAEGTAREARSGDFLSEQWHLDTAKVQDAWQVSRGTRSVTIAILDDGVDTGHPEFNGKIVHQFDFESHVADGSPRGPADKHGTACAGVAVASGVKAFGSAPDCTLMAIRTPDFLGIADEARMFKWAADNGADVISCSWGPADGTGAVDPLPDSTRKAISHCVREGRGGKGIPVFWAAGNGNESVSRDGYAANPDVMAVAASTDREGRAHYSDFGPEIWVCAPSSGRASLGERAIFTVDRRGAQGYNAGSPSQGDPTGDYTNDFGGTSSATPLVAGVAGLMLSVNRELEERHVREILAGTAEKIGDAASYDSNGHSNQFGFGRIHAAAAVRAARDQSGGSSTGGGTSTGGSSTSASRRPSIRGPEQVNRSGGAPSFDVDPGDNGFYAVEIATHPQLLVSRPADDANYYASWQDSALLAESPYLLPTAVWNRLKHADRLYYRMFTSASPSDWVNWEVTTSDAEIQNGQSLAVVAASSGSGSGSTASGRPSIRGPEEISRSDGPPSFDVDPGRNTFYAVELASRPELLLSRSGDDSNYYATWLDSGMFASNPYTLPAVVWNRLKSANRLYYRVFTSASDGGWVDWDVSTPDEDIDNTRFMTIRASAGDASSGGTGTAAATVTYPSGARFAVVESPGDGVNYSDPTAGGAVPLIEVRGRGDDLLSANFSVRELAARDNVRYARIAPELVAALQRLRERVGRPIRVNSGYRHPALNAEVGGADRSRHLAGQAADIRCDGLTPLELAELALDAMGCDIGIGLGRRYIHVDIRGRLTSWTYEGAELSETEFDAWVRDACSGRLVRGLRASRFGSEAPTITGPERWSRTVEAPRFLVETAGFEWLALEAAARPELFDAARHGDKRTQSNFYHRTFRAPEDEVRTTCTLSESAWALLRDSGRLYYRVVVPATGEANNGMTGPSSTPDTLADEAPWIDLTGGREVRRVPAIEVPAPSLVRAADEQHWRNGDEA